MSSDSARRRAEARARWPGRVVSLSDQEDADQDDAAIVRHGTAADRVAMVWRITRDVWAASGRPFPRYTRATMPGRVIRLGDD